MSPISKDIHFWTRRAAIAGVKGLQAVVPPIQSYSRVTFHMDTVFWLCAAHGFPLESPRVLDPFAGSGINMSHSYLDRATHAHLCGIDRGFARLAGTLAPNVTAIPGDSFRMLNEGDPRLGTYDLTVLDNNLGGVYYEYCEHCDGMPGVFRHFDGEPPHAVPPPTRARPPRPAGRWRATRWRRGRSSSTSCCCSCVPCATERVAAASGRCRRASAGPSSAARLAHPRRQLVPVDLAGHHHDR